MKITKRGYFLKRVFSLLAVITAIFSASAQTNLAVIVRHAPNLGYGTILGSLQQLQGDSLTVNQRFSMTGDLLVPGTPAIILIGRPAYAGTIVSGGKAAPSKYNITLDGACSLRYLRTRTLPVSLPAVAPPPRPEGTRIVYINNRWESFSHFSQELSGQHRTEQQINALFSNKQVSIIHAGQSYGDAATLRDLILNADVGVVAVPPGTYGNFVVNSGSTLVLGVAGGLKAVNYNLENLNLNGRSNLRIVGPVILTVANGFICNGIIGESNNPAWLRLQIAKGGLTLNDDSTVYGLVLAPNGTVKLNANAKLVGTSASDKFILNNGGLVSWGGSVQPISQQPTAISQTVTVGKNSSTNLNLTGAGLLGGTLTFMLLKQPVHGILTGTPPSVTYQPTSNYSGRDDFTFKVNNGTADSAPATVSLTVKQIYLSPTAVSQTLTNFENTALPATLTGYDPQGYPLKFSVLTQPGHGSLSGKTPNLIYHPTTNYFGDDFFTFRVNDGVSNSAIAAININNQPLNYPPVVIAGPNQLIILPTNIVHLSGSVFYSFFPGTVNTVAWSQTSGPGVVTFASPSNALTSATFSQPGIYQLRLFASNSFLSSSNDLLVTVDAMPVVAAGQTMTNTFPGTITLNGSATDDGLPTNGTLRVVWNKVSGPGTVVFGKTTATNSTATFSTNGIYVLRLTANDGIATNHAELVVVENIPPLVKAGPSQTVVLGMVATLAGTVTDDGLPNGTLNYLWSQIGGPGSVGFSAVNSNNTTASFSVAGIYTLRLTANDIAASGNSEITLTVLTTNHPPQALGQSLVIDENSALTVTLNGTDPDGGTLNFSIVTRPIHGTLSGIPPDLIYHPTTNYIGDDSFIFVASDGQTNSMPATVSIRVNSSSITPVISVPAQQVVLENEILEFNTNRLISITSPNTSAGLFQLYLSVTNGMITLGSTNGLNFIAGSNDSPNMVVNGSLNNLNKALMDLDYIGVNNFHGVDTLIVGVDDSTNVGGPLTDSKSVAIIITALNNLTKDITAGTDFWVARLPASLTFRLRYIMMLADKDTVVTVTSPERNFPFNNGGSFSSEPGGVSAVNLKANAPYLGALEFLNKYSPFSASDVITNTAFHLSSTQPISVYVVDFTFGDSDAFRALPTSALGTNYIIQSYSNSKLFPGYIFGSQFSITSVETNTLVTIVPAVTTSGHSAGQPYDIMLQPGATYTLRHTETPTGDLTGSSVTADKPVLILAGNALTGIPSNQNYYASGVSEQLMPVERWDSEYVITRLANQTSYAVRILAARDGTAVSLPGIGETNLSRGQYWELFLTNDLQVIASQPVAVCQYVLSGASLGLPVAPAMLWIPGVHQGLTDFQWMTPESVHTLNFGHVVSTVPLFTNFFNLVVPSGALNSLRINGNPLPADSSWSLVGNGQYLKVSLPVTNGVYKVHCSEPVIMVNYGFIADVRADGPSSYGLAGPFSLPMFPLKAQVFVSAPTNGSIVTAGQEAYAIVQITDPQQLVTNVEFIVNGIMLSEGSTTNFAWTPTQAGNYTLQFIADTLTGQSVTSAPVQVTANLAFASEGVIISYPFDGESVYDSVTTLITLDFDDPSGSFDHAEFFANNISLGQTTNTIFNWRPTFTNDYIISATIYDHVGNYYDTTYSPTVHAISPPRPILTITSPNAGSRVRAGVESVIIASVYDPGQLNTNVQFVVDGLKFSDNTTYYSWMPDKLGNHTLQAIALTSDGEHVYSEIINVIVAEMFPPLVKLLSPTNNEVFTSGTARLFSAQATDADGLITNLIFTLDNAVLIETNIAVLAFPITNTAPGWHEIVVQATDNDGLSSSSEVVRFFMERAANDALPVPDRLAAQALSTTEIQLAWSPVATNEPTQNILIQRWNAVDSLWSEINQISATSSNYLDSALNPETNYRYRIACTDTNGNRSAYSAETNATTRTVIASYAVIDLSTAVASLLTNLVPGGNILTNSGLPQFDVRRTVPLGTHRAETILGTNKIKLRQAVARFTERWPQIQLDYDPGLLSPHSLMPRIGYLTGPGGSGVTVPAATAQMFDPADPYQPIKAFLQEYRDLFGFGPEEITNAAVQRNYVSSVTGARTVVWQQQVGGVSIFNALFIGHITATGELAAVACDFIPAPTQAADPSVVSAILHGYDLPLNGAQALQVAVANVGDVFATTDIISQSAAQGIVRSQSYVAGKGIKGVAHAGLTWFPTSRNELKLAWQIIFSSQWRNEMYLAVVSAEDGEIFYRRNLTADSSDASYRVFTDASPTPMSPGWPTPNNAQPPMVDRNLVTLTALDTNASPNGWINDGDNQTLGNNVDAFLDRNDDDLPDLSLPTGKPSRIFDFGLNLGFDPSNYGDASVVQLFYWDNWMHDVLYGLGFTEGAGNFQTDNFGRGGADRDALQAEAQDGLNLNDSQHLNNASMSTPPDGFSPAMQMHIFNGANTSRDASLDAEIVLHEYAHGLSSRLVGGGAGIDAQQTMGLGEGWSDFFALALLEDPTANPDGVYPVGSYVAYHGFGTLFDENYYYGIRHYPYCTDTNKNPLTFADIDPVLASAHVGILFNPLTGSFDPALAGEAHSAGEVWCVMLWEMRANLIHKLGGNPGNSLALHLVTDGMRFSPPNANFVQARDAILLADRISSNGENASEIWAAFSKRVLGYDAKAHYSYTTMGAQESYSPAPALVIEQMIVQEAHGTGIIGTNADNDLLLIIHNQGTAAATQVSAQITTATPGVQIIQAQSSFGDIPQNQSRNSSVALQIRTFPEFVTGTTIDLNVTITSDQQSVVSTQNFYTGVSGPDLPDNGNSSATPTSGSAVPKDLTPWDLGNLEPLWMADDASCLLKAGPGKYILWRPGEKSIAMVNPNFLAHRLTKKGVIVGELATDLVIDNFGNVLPNVVGAQWIPGQPAPTPLTTGTYTYPKKSLIGQNVGLVYDPINLTGGGLTYLGSVGVYPTKHSVWDMNAHGLSVGAASVYLRPPDANQDGYISTNEVRLTSLEQHAFDINGNLQGVFGDERTLSAGHAGNETLRVYYNSFLTSAAQFATDANWNWIGPVNFSGGSVFSVGLLINDEGDVAGTGATLTGNSLFDAYSPTRVFRWNADDGEFSLSTIHVHALGLLPGGQHGFPLGMNRTGDIVGYSDLDILNSSQIHAAFWDATTDEAQDLGTLTATQGNSHAFSINDNRQVVGVSQKSDGSSAGVQWQFNHNFDNANETGFWEIINLNDLLPDTNWNVFNAVDINTNGLILANARNAAGENHAVLLIQMAMAVDNNRDGQISFGRDDQTTLQNPYRFWINNDHDAVGNEADVQDDLITGIVKDSDSPIIGCARDLEDFTRLWIDTKDIIKDLKNGTFFIGFRWENVINNPEMRIFKAAEIEGGSKYLTDPSIAAQQIDSKSCGKEMIDEFGMTSIKAGGNHPAFIIPQSFWADVLENSPVAHFLFEGVNRGGGKLIISIYKNDRSTKIMDGPSIFIKLQDVKELYERWTVDPATSEDSNGGPPANVARISKARGLSGFQYNSGSPEDEKYILFIHGWNLPPWEKDAFAETSFKRLYWQGYKGRFGAFQWPTTYHDAHLNFEAAFDFDQSEYTAWKSGRSLESLLIFLHQQYGDNVNLFAHSHGNVVAGEALRLAAQDGLGKILNTYVASQAAIPAHCYDPAQPLPEGFFNSWRMAGGISVYPKGPSTPNIYLDWLTGNSVAVTSQANFYNVNDYALSKLLWETDQAFKPDSTGLNAPYGYAYNSETPPVEDGFTKFGIVGFDHHVLYGNIHMHMGNASDVKDRYEILAFAAEPRCHALGATPNAAGFDSLNLSSMWPTDQFSGGDYHLHPWHSAQFRFTNMEQKNYWHVLLDQFHLLPITQNP